MRKRINELLTGIATIPNLKKVEGVTIYNDGSGTLVDGGGRACGQFQNIDEVEVKLTPTLSGVTY